MSYLTSLDYLVVASFFVVFMIGVECVVLEVSRRLPRLSKPSQAKPR